MSSGTTKFAAIDVAESAADVPTDPGVTRIRRSGGVMQQAVAGGAWQSLGPDAWFDSTVIALRTLVPAITRYEYVKVGNKANGSIDSAIAVDGSTVGGSLGVASDTTHLKFTPAIWATPRTDVMAVAFRVKFPAIAVGKTSVVAICITAAGGNIPFGWDHGTSPTKWVLLPTGGAPVISTVNADTAWHTVLITSDGTTITAVVDGVTVATSTAVATLTNSPSGPSVFSSASLTPGATVNRLIYGYVDP